MSMKVNQINIYGVNASKIANEVDKSKYYGKKVIGYTPQNGSKVGWKIFYADQNNIYLIADDYVDRNSLPSSTNLAENLTMHKPNEGADLYPKSAYFTNILLDYDTGSERIRSKYPKAIQELNKSYFVDNPTYSSGDNNNMKAVAYMLDTIAWSAFKDKEGKSLYAIGGPTIEMIFKSYNQKHPEMQYEVQAASTTGYKIRVNEGDWKFYTDLDTEYFDATDTLYVLPTSNGANSMWVASPCGSNPKDVMYILYNGSVSYSGYDGDNRGFRPLVCLNSNVQLQEAENGFIIKQNNEKRK